MDFDLTRSVKIVPGQTSPEDALAAGNYPASGSYVDVSNYRTAICLIHLGAVSVSDTPTFEVKEADAVNGTLDTLSATYAKLTQGAADDDETCAIVINTEKLSADHHFLSCVVSGVATGSYGEILWLLAGPRREPVTQPAAFPAANINRYQ